MTFRANRSGSSLVEMMISAMVVLMVGAAGLMSVIVINRSSRSSLDRIRAEALLERSRTDLGRATATFFDSLQNCQFPESLSGGQSTCGLPNLPDVPQYEGFSRRMDVRADSPELKTVALRVEWMYEGVLRREETAIRVARPSEAMPGNIIGCVRDAQNPDQLISGAVIRATPVEGSSTRAMQVLSSSTLFFENINFSFADEVTGSFILNPGIWTLSATHRDYLDYVYEDVGGGLAEVVVNSGRVTRLPECLEMEPLPGPASVRMRVLRRVSEDPEEWALAQFFSAHTSFCARTSRLNIGPIEHSDIGCVDGRMVSGVFDQVFNVPREMITEFGGEVCLTIYTNNTYLEGLVGEQTCRGGGLTHERSGWSSARYHGGALQCFRDNGQPVAWNGDRNDGERREICVGHGDEITVNVPLVDMPTLTIQGRIYMEGDSPAVSGLKYDIPTSVRTLSTNHPLRNSAGFFACYYRDYRSGRYQCQAQRANGAILPLPPPTSSAPDADRFFHSCDYNSDTRTCGQINAAGINYRLQTFAFGTIFTNAVSECGPNAWFCNLFLRGSGQLMSSDCCGVEDTQAVGSGMQVIRPGELRPAGKTITRNIRIPLPATPRCGNVEGVVRNAIGKAGIQDATVTISPSGSRSTQGAAGGYLFACPEVEPPPPDPVYRVPLQPGQHTVSKDRYYKFTTYYYDALMGRIYRGFKIPNLSADALNTYPDIYLFPRRDARSVTFEVTSSHGEPLEGVVSELNIPGVYSSKCTTNSNGRCTLSNVPETWPPPDLAGFDPGLPKGVAALHSCPGGDQGDRSYFCYGPSNYDIWMQAPQMQNDMSRMRMGTVANLREEETRLVPVELTLPSSGSGDDGAGGL